MAEFAVGLGTNLGDRAENLRTALTALAALPDVFIGNVSSLYESAPWGVTDQPAFLNACAILQTNLSPQELLDACLAIERAMGRVREEKWGSRLIDIDLVWWSGRAIQTEPLTLPHPFAHERAFVLLPLLEIAPDLTLRGEHLTAHLARLPLSDVDGLKKIISPEWQNRG